MIYRHTLLPLHTWAYISTDITYKVQSGMVIQHNIVWSITMANVGNKPDFALKRHPTSSPIRPVMRYLCWYIRNSWPCYLQWPLTVPTMPTLQLCYINENVYNFTGQPTRLPPIRASALCLGYAILWHRSVSPLAQVMACCLMAASHYQNQCWLIIERALWHSPESNFTRRAHQLNLGMCLGW